MLSDVQCEPLAKQTTAGVENWGKGSTHAYCINTYLDYLKKSTRSLLRHHLPKCYYDRLVSVESSSLRRGPGQRHEHNTGFQHWPSDKVLYLGIHDKVL